jgi:hypothetical protein
MDNKLNFLGLGLQIIGINTEWLLWNHIYISISILNYKSIIVY